ncbi:MAG: DNA polymerase III subunit gamma/tau [Peptoniphilaceae bacterium]
MQTLYRAFRPDTFDKVVGQDNIVHILKNQVQTDTVRHAYLFHGTRGTGKTSCAKILARAVNCLQPKDGNPCNECENCRAILEESTMDVTEMDAASNRRIDDIRDLREKVKYLPGQLKKKVVIIDEAHMITNEGFNALLKTLEEPPAHLLFILATTEMEKIPQTIVSRCQIFTFRRIAAEDIQKNLRYVLEQVNRGAEPEALETIAYAADGAMRDALSSLEQVLSVAEGDITLRDVQTVTGRVSAAQLFALSDAVFAKDAKQALLTVQAVRAAGKESESILADLTEHFRKLILTKVTKDRRLFSGSDEQFSLYTDKSAAPDEELLLAALSHLLDTQNKLRFTDDAHTLLITAVLSLCALAKKKTLEQRIHELEEYVFVRGKPAAAIGTGPVPAKDPDPTDAVGTDPVPAKDPDPTDAVGTGPVPAEDPDPTDAVGTGPVPAEDPEPTPAPASDAGGDSITARDWEKILENIKRRSVPTYAYLHEGKWHSFANDRLTIVFPDNYEIHRNAVNKKDSRALIEEETKRLYGAPVDIQFLLDKEREDKKPVADVQDIIDYFGADHVELQ